MASGARFAPAGFASPTCCEAAWGLVTWQKANITRASTPTGIVGPLDTGWSIRAEYGHGQAYERVTQCPFCDTKYSGGMVHMARGDIFCGANCAVIPVNCVGTMGAGLAKVFAKLCPLATREYKKRCANGDMSPGSTFAVVTRDLAAAGLDVVIFLATKDHWRNPSDITWIEAGLVNLESIAATFAETSIRCGDTVAIPALGCGEKTGQLPWSLVRPKILASARKMFMFNHVLVFDPVAGA